MDGVRLVAAEPRRAELVLRFEEPWEYGASFFTVIKDGELYRMYYRSRGTPQRADEATEEVVCYAESADGIAWRKPALGLHAYRDRVDTNIVLSGADHRVAHNFAPMRDDRPGVPAAERFKAVGGKGPTGAPSPGLFRYVSADGIRWKLYSDEPLFAGYALDSHNVISWLPGEQCYAIYLRTWTEGGTPEQPRFRGFRTVSRATSKDFVAWTTPQPMDFGDTAPEHIYTNGTHPYFRAPHILVSLARRYFPDRQAYRIEEQVEWGVPRAHAKGIADAVLMSSRGGNRYDRTFMESFLRPGPDKLAWHARENLPSMGVVPTGLAEMSFYVLNHFPMPSQHLTRAVLRLDGFASLRAGHEGGTAETKPLIFSGRNLSLNLSTSASGFVSVAILDPAGRQLAQSEEITGDTIERIVRWKEQGDLAAFSGKAVTLRFTLHDADLFAFQFTN